jgi:hypothetical protein
VQRHCCHTAVKALRRLSFVREHNCPAFILPVAQ